ncbi:unnamed protein product, partial [Ascophyllum nodosum]
LFCFFGNVAYSEYFCTITVFSLYRRVRRTFSPFWMVFFYRVTTDWIFDVSHVRIQSINQIEFNPELLEYGIISNCTVEDVVLYESYFEVCFISLPLSASFFVSSFFVSLEMSLIPSIF